MEPLPESIRLPGCRSGLEQHDCFTNSLDKKAVAKLLDY